MKSDRYRNFNDKIHLVYSYEIPEFNVCYVGRTKNLHDRHLSHCRGKKHSDGSITFDSLYIFCKEKNISIPNPIIKEENLTAVESLEKEDFWVKKYRENGWFPLNKAKTGKNSGSLGHVKMWDYNSCKEECKKYKTRSDLKLNSFGCYEVCLENGWLSDFIKIEGKKPNGFWDNKDNVIKESEKYVYVKDFVKKSNGAYAAAKRNGWLCELHFYKKEDIDVNDLWQFYNKCGNIKIVMDKYHIGYKRILSLFNEHGFKMGNHNRKDPTEEELIKIKECLENKISYREIERRYNISRKRLKKLFNL